jgi:23S rRNA (uracil1939-C5)-methyltransferase
MLKAGDLIAVTIEKPAVGGPMIGRHDGRVVLVSGAIPGERVQARILRVTKGVAHAAAVAIEVASPDRREDTGDLLCGGCLYGHIAYPRQLAIKSQVIADAFTRIARLELAAPVTVAGSREDGYRMRARLHVRGSRAGFFREGTHDLCDARVTGQLLPATLETIERLMAAIRSIGADLVREIELSENLDGSERVAHLETSEPLDPRLVEKLVSVEGLTPGPYVTDAIAIGDASLRLRRHVLSFFQGNRHLLSRLVAHVAERVPVGSTVLDLYAGVGLFSVAAAVTRGASVTAIEGDPQASADLHANGLAAGGQMATLRAPVESVGATGAGVLARLPGMGIETVIVDPPRTGMSAEAIGGVLKVEAPRLIYVSCDAATLARDARKFVDGGYIVERIDAFDMFPNTPHVETVVVFRKS